MQNEKKQRLIDLLNDTEFTSVLCDNLFYAQEDDTEGGKQKLIETFAKYKKDLQSSRFVVPVVGIQGCGKSSFLNALLMDGAPIPRDVDETTCIPTEIVYNHTPSSQATIHFIDGKIEKCDATEEALKPYLHNRYNPGNEKGVERVVLESSADLLKDGLVLVDLPGLGSLTEANQKVTIEYLKESTAGIYILRTTPPMTRFEESQLSLIWPTLRKMWFVQNQWDDEGAQEVKDGKHHNELTINNIIKKNPLINAGSPKVNVVNIYKALDLGKLSNNEENIHASGLVKYINEFSKETASWSENLTATIKQSLIGFIGRAFSHIDEKRHNFSADKDRILNEMKFEEEEFNAHIEKVEKQVKQLKKSIDQFSEYIVSLLKDQIEEYEKKMRNAMREIIRGGVVDGDSLDIAYKDNSNANLLDLQDEITKKFNDFIDKISTKIGELDDWDGAENTIDSTPGIEEKTKYEAFATVGTGVAGAGIGFAVGGPFGAAIGGLVGAFVGLFVQLGSSHLRKSHAQKEVFELIENDAAKIKKNIKNDLTQNLEKIQDCLIKWVDNQKSERRAKKKEILHNMSMSKQEKDELVLQLTQQERVLNDAKTTIKG